MIKNIIVDLIILYYIVLYYIMFIVDLSESYFNIMVLLRLIKNLLGVFYFKSKID